MNRDRIEGNWKHVKASVRQTWGKLTDHHSDAIVGTRDGLAEKLYGSFQRRRRRTNLHRSVPDVHGHRGDVPPSPEKQPPLPLPGQQPDKHKAPPEQPPPMTPRESPIPDKIGDPSPEPTQTTRRHDRTKPRRR